MGLSNLSLHELERAIALVKERESLCSQINRIDDQLRQLDRSPIQNRSPADDQAPHVPKSKRRRKSIQSAVIKVLEKAGAEGLTIMELALRAKVKSTSLRTWLYTKGKTLSGLVKKAEGRFSYKHS